MSPSCNPVVIRFGRLGDTVLLQPLLQKLCARYGQPCHLLALGDWPSVLYSAQPEVGDFIPLSSQYGPLWMRPQRWRVALALSRLRQSPLYICEPAYRAGTKLRPLLKLAGIPADHCQFIEDLPMKQDEHWLDWLARFSATTPPAFCQSFGPSCHARSGAPHLSSSAGERVDRDAWLRAQGIAGRPVVLLQAANKRTMRWNGVRAAEDDVKSWPIECWAKVAHAVVQCLPQAKVLFCGSAAEAPYLRRLKAAGADTPDIDLAVLPLGRLKALQEIAHSMISVDTGPAHLAAAMGCPLAVLFGGRSPLTWAPRSGRGSAVSVIGGLPDIQRLDQIDPEQVIKAWRDLRLSPSVATQSDSRDEMLPANRQPALTEEGLNNPGDDAAVLSISEAVPAKLAFPPQ